MAKDPAVLWYWNDWGGGTRTLSRHLKGCYMDLLEAQFNSGPLSLEEIKTVLGNDFAMWGALSKKFKKTAEGLFFNERLETEKAKRTAYCESRKKNRKSEKKHMNGHMRKHMFQHMENENENRNEIRIEKGGVGGKTKNAKKLNPPELKEVESYFIENGFPKELAKKAFDYYHSADWHDSEGKPVRNWKQKMIAVWFKDENRAKIQTSYKTYTYNEIVRMINEGKAKSTDEFRKIKLPECKNHVWVTIKDFENFKLETQ